MYKISQRSAGKIICGAVCSAGIGIGITAIIQGNGGRNCMEKLKKIFTDIYLHLNAKSRTLTIIHGESQITLSLDNDNKVRLNSNLVLENPNGKSPSSKID